jgi:hypothetical protein
MRTNAPLQVTVEIHLGTGSAAGERRLRLSRELELPPRLRFAGSLPLEGEGEGRVRFVLPDGAQVETLARLFFDPEHPERGSAATLYDLEAEELLAIEAYIEERSAT